MYRNILNYQPLIHLTKRFLEFKKKNYNRLNFFFANRKKKIGLDSPATSRRRRPQNDVRPSAALSACVHFGRHTHLRAL